MFRLIAGQRLGSKRSRRIALGVALLAAASLVVAQLSPARIAGPRRAPGVLAPGSNGSLHHYSWWDPRGWFTGGGVPRPRVLHGNVAAVPSTSTGRLPRQSAVGPVHRVRELTGKRDAYTRVYELSDGHLQAVISGLPLNYRDAAGQWRPVSTAVAPVTRRGYVYGNESNTFASFFGATTGSLVRFEAPGGGWLNVGLATGHTAHPLASGDTVTYRQVMPGVNVSYQVTPASLKERITLASAAAAASLAAAPFVIKVGGGLAAYQRPDGSIALSRDGVGGTPVLVMPKPFMTGARPDPRSPYATAWSPKVSQRASWDPATGTLRLSVTADAGWLRHAAFPVVIDPTISIAPTPSTAQNTMILADAASSNFDSSWRLSVGTDSGGAVRSLLSFPLGAVPPGTQLASADLELYYDQDFGSPGSNETLEAHQATASWDASTATWANASNNVGQLGSNLVFDPNANTWDVFSVSNIVQSWLDGTSPNYGFVVKDANESTLNQGGPRYEASRYAYNGEVATYPQLVLTYGIPGVTPNPVTTIHATGADLSWSAYTDPTPGTNPGDDLAEYQVHRSVFQSFDPSADTLVAPVPAGTTSFTDTTNTPTPPGNGALGNAFYYMIAVKTQDGTVIPGPVQLVRLPTAGSTTKIINAAGDTTLSSAQPATNEEQFTGEPYLGVGDNSATYGVTRTVVNYPSMASAGVPADATVTDAELKLWGWYNLTTSGNAIYEAHALTQSFDPATATWNNASSGTAWATPGGAYSATTLGTVTSLTNDPNREEWPVTAAAQDWVTNPAGEHGLLVKLSGETSSDPQERELFLNSSAVEPKLRPELVVTYTEPTAQDTYYAPALPGPMNSAASYTVPVTLTNTTAATWAATDWVLSYHWQLPDGTDVSSSANQAQTPLPADMTPSSVATINATVTTPDSTGSGGTRTGYVLKWDLYNKTTGTWLSATGSTNGVSPLSQFAAVTQPTSNKLGLEKFYQYTGINTGSGSSVLGNLASGNAVWSYNAFSNPSRGFQTFVRMAYNSLDTSDSAMGFGWSLEASTVMRLGTPLDFHPNPNPTTITLTDGDGTGHLFVLNSSTGVWQSPPGVHLFLQQLADCSANGKDPASKAWVMTRPDRTRFFFDCQGYQSAVVDRNGNEADFTYTQRNSSNKPVKFLSYITDPAGRQTLTLSYYQKGDGYSFIDSGGNVASGTNLTNPFIIDQVKSITGISGRTITFLYDTEGLMAQMTDGDGTSVAKVFKFGYDMTQGNKNVKLVSVTDPRGHTTALTYDLAQNGDNPAFQWMLKNVTDRRGGTVGFAYTTPDASGNTQAQVTDQNSHTTTYVLDSTGRPVQSTNALGQVTKLAWDSGNNVTSLTEDNGAITTFTYDQNTGYPLTMTDALANKNGTASTTYTYQTGLSGHIADLTAKLTPQQRLWTFGYDTNGNLTSVTDPDGNAVSPPSGFTTNYTYDATGQLQTATDANRNKTTYSSYDPNGYPQAITDALGNTTHFAYDVRGNVTSVTDPLGHTTTQAYDVFGRPGQKVVPKDQAAGVYITTPAPVYDGNDNVTQQTAPDGAVTTFTYDANDGKIAQFAPQDTSTSPQRETTYAYDPAGNLTSVTEPDGNQPSPPSSFTTTYGYDAINERTSVTDAASKTTSFGYDNAGNRTSVTNRLGHTAKYAYDLDHRQTSVTDPAGFTTSKTYDLDGLVTSVTDQNGSTTLYTLDPRGKVTQMMVPHDTSGSSIVYDTTQFAYDQAGNRVKVITPRGVASGVTNAFTLQTTYDADNRVAAQLSAYDPNDPVYNTPAETGYTYDAAGRITSVSAPPSGNQAVRNVTTYGYFDNGWTKSSTDPWDITTSYGYNELGEQSTRTITSAGGSASPASRTMTWDYYPDGKLKARADHGVPTGLATELADDSDFNNTSSTGTWTASSAGTGFQGTGYQTHAAGTGTDAFTWNLNIPQDGNYTVYVKYPAVPGAATNASFKVSFSGGSSTVAVDQTQNAGTWVSLGKFAFTQGGTGENITLTENRAGTVVADAILVVRDNSGDTNTALHSFGYSYDPNGNLTDITDSSPNAAINDYQVSYDGLNRVSQVAELASGVTKHTTTFGYDADSNLASRSHDGAPSSYSYDVRNLLSTETDAQSASDPSPQVTTFTFNGIGQLASEVKPNGNTVTSTYFADSSLQHSIETKPDGTTVAEHTYTYDPNRNKIQDIEKLMSADNNAADLSHTLAYTYDPRDRVAQVTKDGTVTESYTHDANDNVTSQTVNGTSTTFNFDRNRLLTAVTNGVTAGYNYDPFGRLDAVTAAGQVQERNTYDGFDHVTEHQQLNSAGGLDITDYTYDPLDRKTSQTTGVGTSAPKTTDFAYLGLSSQLISELQNGTQTRSYTYTPYGQRLSQTIDNSDGTKTPGYYSYNLHSDVEAVTGGDGNTKSTYGYTAYGQSDPGQFTGADKNNTNPGASVQPFSAYRYNAMRWDSSSAQYDMGFRNYDPSLNQFLSRDMYDGALSDMSLDTDPFTGNRYSFGAGNPVSNIELTGHKFCSPDNITPDCDAIRGAPTSSSPPGPQCQPSDSRCITVTPNPGVPGFQQHTIAVFGGGAVQWCTYGDKVVDCGSYAQYAEYVVKYAKDAGIDPVLLMAILLNEQKPLAYWPRKDIGLGSMNYQSFQQAAAFSGGKFSDSYRNFIASGFDPELSIEATAWKLAQLQSKLPKYYTGELKPHELIAAAYNAGDEYISGEYPISPSGPGSARWRYLQNLNANWQNANQLICQSGVYSCAYQPGETGGGAAVTP